MANKNKRRSPREGSIKSWILFAVILVTLFGGLMVWQNQAEKQGGQLPSQKPTGDAEPSRPFAFPEKENEKEKTRRDQQGLHEAWSRGSEEACKTIADPLLEQQCRETLRLGLLIKGTNEKQCEELKEAALQKTCADQMVYKSATSELDLERCQKISDPALRQNCLDKIQSLAARRGETVSECKGIQDNVLKKECLNQVHYRQSIEALNEDGCKAITQNALALRCQAVIAQNKRVIVQSTTQPLRPYQNSAQRSKTCDGLDAATGSACHDETNFNLALEKKDLSYCQKISDLQKQNECLELQGGHLNRFYLKQAITKKDTSLCQKILQEPLRQSCQSYSQSQ